jgi:predicted Zn-dependent peptidase
MKIGALCGSLLVVAAVAVGAQGPDRSKAPALGAPPELNLPPIQKRALSNGLPVWIVEQHEVPLVQVNLLVLAGSGDDPAGKFGVASLTAAMLDEGAASKSALQIADEIDFLGAAISTTSSFDASGVRLNVPRARLEAALPIMADVALRPTFPEEELERLRQERLTALLQAKDDPASVGPLAFSRIVYGPSHRYGTSALGTESTLKAFTREDLRAFHAARYQPSLATLVVAGDVTADAILPLLETHFGTWRGPSAPQSPPLPQASQPRESQIYIVDMPGAEQSVIRIGWVGVARSTPDYFPLQVLNTVLGGSFTSRLNQNLREEHGYAYGASSGFDMRLSAGPFSARANVQTDKTAEALREFFNELNAITKPIPAEELEKAKNYIALGFPSQFETIGDLSGQLEDLIVYKLPDTYFEEYVANIRRVTPEAVQKVAGTYIQPTRFAIVVVGDRKTIEPGIRALKLAPVQVMTVEAAVGS